MTESCPSPPRLLKAEAERANSPNATPNLSGPWALLDLNPRPPKSSSPFPGTARWDGPQGLMVPSNPKEGGSQEARAEHGCHSLGMESLVVCDGARLRREGGCHCGQLALPTGAHSSWSFQKSGDSEFDS